MLRAFDGDGGVARRLGQDEGALQYGLGVQCEALGRPVALHAERELGIILESLGNVKLTDVNWHHEAGKSFALFSVLAMPKQ